MLFQAIKTRSLKSRKMGVFPKRPWFWSKSINFSILLFQAKKARKMCFTIFQKEKSLSTLKNKKFKKSKNYNFSIEVSPWFWPKIAKFSSFDSRQNRPGKCVSRYCKKKKRLLQTIKTRSLKSRKLVFLANGLVHDFGQKLAIFPLFYVRQLRPGKCVSRYSRKKKRVSTL